jgi:hypothetical protein
MAALRLQALCDGEPIVPQQVECGVGEGRVSSSLCIPCAEDTYSLDTSGACLPCPRGAVCTGGSHIGAARDFWQNPNDLADLYRCDPGVCCIDSPTGYCDLDSPLRCGDRRNANGTLCGTCAEGYGPSGSSCVRCTGANPSLLALAVVMGLVLVAFLLAANGDDDTGGFSLFKVYADFVQVMGIVMGASRLAAIRLDVTALDLSNLLGMEEFPCLFPMSPFGSAFFSLGWTGALLGLFLVVFLAEGLVRKSMLVASGMGGWGSCLCPSLADEGRLRDPSVVSADGEGTVQATAS